VAAGYPKMNYRHGGLSGDVRRATAFRMPSRLSGRNVRGETLPAGSFGPEVIVAGLPAPT